ncbi:hypothetical protein BV25DRAFT_1916921 [Artomyces pyxidatus]|uniref:Uncharacterized protein n=1 Tax=Artomyces pyxidatus TaxID=48021 RepID=A0ACB8SYJ4_9AGAM|nr:hypothetical protein BV25DRAFT_1916921 [Artomyces pyxidatus]
MAKAYALRTPAHRPYTSYISQSLQHASSLGLPARVGDIAVTYDPDGDSGSAVHVRDGEGRWQLCQPYDMETPSAIPTHPRERGLQLMPAYVALEWADATTVASHRRAVLAAGYLPNSRHLYPFFKHMEDTGGKSGVRFTKTGQFPDDARTLPWSFDHPREFFTNLPPPEWSTEEWNVSFLSIRSFVQLTGTESRKTVEAMSRLGSAFNANPPLAVRLTYGQTDSAEEHARLAVAIRRALSNNVTVVVEGWEPRYRLDLTVDGLAALFNCAPDTPIQPRYFSANRGRAHARTALRDFVGEIGDRKTCGNLLDRPTRHPEVPPFVRAIADDVLAQELWDRTGPPFVLVDAERRRGWRIATHGGALTFPHHDAAGLCTYTYAVGGSRLWGFQRPEPFEADFSRKDLQEAIRDHVAQGFPSPEQAGLVLLDPGLVVITPPGAMHTVYTPVAGVTGGGHFYCLDALHLTEHTRALDRATQDIDVEEGQESLYILTNADHASCPFSLVQMLATLPRFDRRGLWLRRRPMLALYNMVASAEHYTIAGEADVGADDRHAKEEFEVAKARALEVGEKLLGHLSVYPQDVSAELHGVRGRAWEAPGPAICIPRRLWEGLV